MQLKDITKEWIIEQFDITYEDFKYIGMFDDIHESAEWSLLKSYQKKKYSRFASLS